MLNLNKILRIICFLIALLTTLVDAAALTKLHVACFKGDKAQLELLLAQSNDCNEPLIEDVEFLDGNCKYRFLSGATGLHMAVTMKHYEIISLLLSHGANINARDTAGNTPLHNMVATYPDPRAIRWLVEQGADLSAINAQERTVIHTILYFAEQELALNCLSALLEANASRVLQGAMPAYLRLLNQETYLMRQAVYITRVMLPPLMLACLHNNTASASYIIKRGHYFNDAREVIQTFALACHKGYFDVVQMLYDLGCQFEPVVQVGALRFKHVRVESLPRKDFEEYPLKCNICSEVYDAAQKATYMSIIEATNGNDGSKQDLRVHICSAQCKLRYLKLLSNK